MSLTPEQLEAQKDVQNYLMLVDDVASRSGGRWAYASSESFVLRHGRVWTPASFPRRLKRGKMGMCFMNAYRLVSENRKLRYVEGYANTNLIPVLHAWAVDSNDKVVDPTWRERKGDLGSSYFGVVFSYELVCAMQVLTGMYGVLATFGEFSLLNQPFDEERTTRWLQERARDKIRRD